ncbi:short-chain dehydrogenase [Streptomyces venezuelae]|uniref:Short-chain dehydrogenase n=1 Tax=Streptomyces venezuelae TaxID=54571 RepID=A0A5P2CV21_STRVZ|nr:SDR family NAD(P)-dependent oxidoreductase [Streptomyces venezuelae]QES45608.1 short-chain dehydrogenase [Streptomyces venezuelae]
MRAGRSGTRVALVTGGGGGIGGAVARRLADEGAAVAVVDRDDAAETVARDIRAGGGHAEAFLCDVSDEEEVPALVKEVVGRLGDITDVCCVAGSIRRGTVRDLSLADWHGSFADNVDSVFLVCRAVLPLMERAGRGSIVTVASGWGLRAGEKAAAYCTAKAGVVMLTQAMALDHSPAGIRVNCVAPGDTRTPMLAREARQLGQSDADFLAEAADRPLGRIGTPEDIAAAVAFLAGPDADFVTGSVLSVDGGGSI